MSFSFRIFCLEFLHRLAKRDEPRTASEADVAGPWRLVPLGGGEHGLFRLGESPERGDRPEAVFADLEHAWLGLALLPGTGRDPLYHLGTEETPRGFPLSTGGEVIGYLRLFNQEVPTAFHTAGCLLRSPDAIARLLQASGSLTLERVDRILAERVETDPAP
jgi:hypothetical protein